ncbi:14643_t:CDS:1, partial [Ambispora leptoticha]
NAERKVFPNRGRGNSRWIVQKATDGGVIQIWNCIRLAGNTLKIAENSISECCSGKRNTAGGWCWMYYEDYIPQDPNEEWREIEYKLRKFKVSSLGRIQLTNGAITQGSLYEGYFRFNQCYIHRLVALAFCSKEEGKNCVNHIDGNRTNNKASNLEWCTQKENTQHAVCLKLWGHCRKRAIKQIFDDGSFREFLSLAEAQRITGIKSQNIGLVCRGLQAHAGGYRW